MFFPSKHKLNLNRDALLAQDFGKASVNDVIRSVQDAFGIIPTIGNLRSGPFAVVRARKIDPARENIRDFRSFGPPPISETSQGRANIVGYPVMYATTDARTAMREISAIPGEEYYVSIWEKNISVPMSISLYTWHASDEVDLRKWVDDAMEFVIKDLKILPKDRKKFLHAMTLRSSLFTMDQYDISSRLAHGLMFNNSQSSNAIIYPSVTSRFKCRIQSVELDPCILRRELPVNFCVNLVAACLPSGNFLA